MSSANNELDAPPPLAQRTDWPGIFICLGLLLALYGWLGGRELIEELRRENRLQQAEIRVLRLQLTSAHDALGCFDVVPEGTSGVLIAGGME